VAAGPHCTLRNVAGAGDINGDGLADLLIGTPHVDAYSYKMSFVRGILASANGYGERFALALGDYDSGLGASVAAAGDVNGDGFCRSDRRQQHHSISYVVFGHEDFAGIYGSLDTELDGENGFRLVGAGGSVDGAGDFNGDGVDDLIVSSTSGDAFLVLGTAAGFAATLDLATLSDEFRFTGAAGQVAGAGDLNDDGYDDLILGSPHADPHGRDDAGSNFVLYGHAMDATGSEIAIARDDTLGIEDTAFERTVDLHDRPGSATPVKVNSSNVADSVAATGSGSAVRMVR
jgi:hypothetical protein